MALYLVVSEVFRSRLARLAWSMLPVWLRTSVLWRVLPSLSSGEVGRLTVEVTEVTEPGVRKPEGTEEPEPVPISILQSGTKMN